MINNTYFYAIYEYVAGESLKKWLAGKPSFSSRYYVLEQIFTEIQKVHEIGIYHGDLHEKNILITPDKKIKIIDFGTISVFKSKKKSHKRETRLLINTGILILKNENKKYNFLEVNILRKCPPECVPSSILMLSKIFREIEELNDKIDNSEIDDYDLRSFLFSLAVSVVESPFFNLQHIIRFLQKSVFNSFHRELFIRDVFSMCEAEINDSNRSYIDTNQPICTTGELSSIYLEWRKKYVNECQTVNHQK